MDEYTDAWFVGFDPKITVGVWVGYDEKKPLGNGETGAQAALPIWMDFMRAYIDAHGDRKEPPTVRSSRQHRLRESGLGTPRSVHQRNATRRIDSSDSRHRRQPRSAARRRITRRHDERERTRSRSPRARRREA